MFALLSTNLHKAETVVDIIEQEIEWDRESVLEFQPFKINIELEYMLSTDLEVLVLRSFLLFVGGDQTLGPFIYASIGIDTVAFAMYSVF